jgi:hypothetical protein
MGMIRLSAGHQTDIQTHADIHHHQDIIIIHHHHPSSSIIIHHPTRHQDQPYKSVNRCRVQLSQTKSRTNLACNTSTHERTSFPDPDDRPVAASRRSFTRGISASRLPNRYVSLNETSDIIILSGKF